MNVSLGPQLESFVDELVDSGIYQSNSEVLRCALRLLREQEHARKIKLESLKRDLQIGVDELDRGERIPGEDVFAELKKRHAAKRKAGLK